MDYNNRRGGNFLSALPPVVRVLLIMNVVLFVLDILARGVLKEYMALYTTNTGIFEPYQVVTHMFMHGGFWHLFMNMFGLYMFGRVLENSINSKRFFILYFLSGLGAAGLQFLVYYLQGTPGAMIGASGAIFGVVAAFAVLYPNVELMIIPIPVPVKAKYLIPGFMGLSIIMGLSNVRGDVIAHFAHLGGAIIGFALIMFWRKNRFRQF